MLKRTWWAAKYRFAVGFKGELLRLDLGRGGGPLQSLFWWPSEKGRWTTCFRCESLSVLSVKVTAALRINRTFCHYILLYLHCRMLLVFYNLRRFCEMEAKALTPNMTCQELCWECWVWSNLCVPPGATGPEEGHGARLCHENPTQSWYAREGAGEEHPEQELYRGSLREVTVVCAEEEQASVLYV